MGGVTFPLWLSLGCYGGVACGLACTAGIVVLAASRHRGTPKHAVSAAIACICSSALTLPAIAWAHMRFSSGAPDIPPSHIAIALLWIAVWGWGVPLLVLAAYGLLATPQPLGATVTTGTLAPGLAPLNDPERAIEPLGRGQAWGDLTVGDSSQGAFRVPLTRGLALLGRDAGNDVVVPGDRVSRFHAEIHWNGGHPFLRDRDSLNGTHVNGQALHGVTPLNSGDRIAIGTTTYRFSIAQEAERLTTDAVADATRKTSAAPRRANQSTTAGVVGAYGVLRGLGGPLQDRVWGIGTTTVVIGRDPGCAIVLPDESVSRRHVQLTVQPAGVFIADLGSSNGTTLDGETIEAPRVLRHGAVLRVGDVALRFEPGPAVIPAVPPGARAGAAIASAQLGTHATAPAPPTFSNAASVAHAGTPTAPPRSGTGSRNTSSPGRARIGPPRLTPDHHVPTITAQVGASPQDGPDQTAGDF